ncbi:hypothetical protein [Photobacterium sp. OFAV2-7]|uniref:hypothetical protein n=1 Tax=Photobacterium sp. OFAV2-7 TaxID=2917748 RepID=UPI001EF488F6|nr:hypothetical protein [Photobacterium sp. OFAV2-7]MCG7584570.1 hypothetical protein [Photobacterium sp. OFAV2-7]
MMNKLNLALISLLAAPVSAATIDLNCLRIDVSAEGKKVGCKSLLSSPKKKAGKQEPTTSTGTIGGGTHSYHKDNLSGDTHSNYSHFSYWPAPSSPKTSKESIIRWEKWFESPFRDAETRYGLDLVDVIDMSRNKRDFYRTFMIATLEQQLSRSPSELTPEKRRELKAEIEKLKNIITLPPEEAEYPRVVHLDAFPSSEGPSEMAETVDEDKPRNIMR